MYVYPPQIIPGGLRYKKFNYDKIIFIRVVNQNSNSAIWLLQHRFASKSTQEILLYPRQTYPAFQEPQVHNDQSLWESNDAL